MLSHSPDAALVDLAQQGQMEAFEELLWRYEKKTYNLAVRLMGNHADASDAAQEAMVRVYTRLRHFRGDSLFSTWLFRVVTNTCLDELRRRGRQRLTYCDTPLGGGESNEILRQVVDPGAPLCELAEQKEVQALVHNALSALPTEYRTVIVLRDIRGHSYHEMADMLGASLGTIKSRLHRARQALKAVLTQRTYPAEATVA